MANFDFFLIITMEYLKNITRFGLDFDLADTEWIDPGRQSGTPPNDHHHDK